MPRKQRALASGYYYRYIPHCRKINLSRFCELLLLKRLECDGQMFVEQFNFIQFHSDVKFVAWRCAVFTYSSF